MNNIHLNVNGLINNPVKTQVRNVLEEIDGVQKVNIDLVRSTVEVDFNPPATENDIRMKIEHVGCKIE